MIREVLSKPRPRRLGVPPAAEPRGDDAGVVERLGLGGRLGHQLLVLFGELGLAALAEHGVRHPPPRLGGQLVIGIGRDEGAQLGQPLVALARVEQRLSERVAGCGKQGMTGVLALERLQERHRFLRALQLHQGPRQIKGRRGGGPVLRIIREQPAEVRRREIRELELPIAPGAPVERIRDEGRGRGFAEYLVVGVARLRVPVHAEERLRLPEPRFPGPAGRG